ncbi:hypothetical protein KOW79_004104 [Hemibagrus wyckioides]|uniref:Uncharacterized protein n=1 Tax=Hemibagrus wyckioides TaxID=337641 RepID=A0A9D3SR42_9TELE|nr:hypothetical protein KOW79_004104 [Hemibagrus wyckioides]
MFVVEKVKLLSAALESPHCTLEILRMCNCSIADEGCAALASALRSNSSSKLCVKKIKKDVHCKLETLLIKDYKLSRTGI